MRAMSLHQPWIQWVVWGMKIEETRTHDRFKCLAGQRICLHQAVKWDKRAIQIANAYLTHSQVLETLHVARETRGHLVCTAKVELARWVDAVRPSILDGEALCRVNGLFCLRLKDVLVFETPIPWRGQQGIFSVPDEIIGGAR